MRRIPDTLRKELVSDPWYKHCAREGDSCHGRITFEHAIIYAGRQVNKKWAIIPLCEYHHSVGIHQDGGGCEKGINELIAISRMSLRDMQEFPRFNWLARLDWLQIQYGIWEMTAVRDEEIGINYPHYLITN